MGCLEVSRISSSDSSEAVEIYDSSDELEEYESSVVSENPEVLFQRETGGLFQRRTDLSQRLRPRIAVTNGAGLLIISIFLRLYQH